MNAHVTINTDRTLLPRGLIRRPRRAYHVGYQYKVGQLVTFGGAIWVVTDRKPTTMGNRLYSIFCSGDERPNRMVLEAALAAA
jgi:hypothetical protein